MLLTSLAVGASLATSSMNGITPTIAATKAAEAIAINATSGIVRFPHSIGRAHPLSTPYITNDPTGHAPQNGRLWISRPMIGPDPSARRINCENPGPLAYGVSESDHTTILVQLGTIKVGISPWQRLEGRANRRLEDARIKWLNDRGYTSGVRTFVNDAYVQPTQSASRDLQPIDDALVIHDEPVDQKHIRFQDIQPRATIQIPADMPRFRKRMHVHNTCTPTIIIADNCSGRPQVEAITGRGNSYQPTRVIVPTTKVASAD
jgi:hypothetical protein